MQLIPMELFTTSTDQGTLFDFTGVYFDPDDPTITDYNSEYLLKKSPNGTIYFSSR